MSADKQQTISSVWTRPRRREQQALSQEQIVAEAVRLLDAEGVEALSMRKLGIRLNAGATSLYRHVANKDELIELVVDEVYGELEVRAIDDPADWRDAVAESACSLRAMALRHPWLASVLGQIGFSDLGPNLMGMSERLLAVFEKAGFELKVADQSMNTVIAYVVGTVTSEAAYLSLLARSGMTEEEWVHSLRPVVREATEGHPRVRTGFEAVQDQDPRQIRDDNFEFGLNRVLDGLESLLAKQAD
ncbi:TetR/AcrR family transcriptional regulator [Streptomyces sp. NPDC059009]|uniref:TetR/AcrR family transcriptional regulator n=1 Tax=Streptomyces sp. NPDC059009 TaxID=3346694 RepID=UPI0036748649